MQLHNYIITSVFIYIITLLQLFGDFRRSWLSLENKVIISERGMDNGIRKIIL